MRSETFAAIVSSVDNMRKMQILLIIQPDAEGVFLFRYTDDQFSGDTWHENTDHAMRQAEYEYAINQQKWMEIPNNIVDHKGSLEPIYRLLNSPM